MLASDGRSSCRFSPYFLSLGRKIGLMELSIATKMAIVEHLQTFLLEERAELIRRVLCRRTRYITVCLEDIYQSQNASAVLRSAEAFGLQDIHIIEANNGFQINRDVVRGSDKWLTLHRYSGGANPTLEAITCLKDRGYRIVATSPHVNGVSLDDFDVEKGKAAIFFGNEHHGISKTVFDNADEYLYIPMRGFTESFNISVAAGMSIHSLRTKLDCSMASWHLSEEEHVELYLDWLQKAVKRSDLTIKRFLEENPHLR